jgi:indolepyruvate ferredoxin oxidoreductase beta subunit
MRRYNIVLAGVGGQGLLTLGRVLGNAAIAAGIDATIAETHGLSQRGGSLIVQVRLGEGESPMIPRGAADLIIGLEALETARRIIYANKDTRIVMNKFIWPPPLEIYPDIEQIIEKIRERGLKLYIIDANRVSEEITGTIISANMAMLGYAYAVDHGLREWLSYNDLEKGLERVFRGKVLELNKKVLRRAYEIGLKETSSDK